MRALALFSSGLDSTLAIKVIANQGIEVIALHFLIPFSRCDKNAQEELIRKTKEQLGVGLKVISLGQEYLDILQSPKFGYGKNLNPCIDCKILMLTKAKDLMAEFDASFIITGEVVGQRPKSQHTDTLCLIEKQAGLQGLLLRPLSAKILPETIPEQQGFVDRNKLYDFHGRTRKPQMSLAAELGIEEYAWPGGGCLLTVESFCGRVYDLIIHKQLTLDNVSMLSIGRHFRINAEYKLIVGRDEKENNQLLEMVLPADYVFEPTQIPGPTAIGRGNATDQVKLISSEIVSHYSRPTGEDVEVSCGNAGSSQRTCLKIKGLENDQIRQYIIT